jgi:rRNA maturation endonuclease Nob1
MEDIRCPACGAEFEAECWEEGECPKCGKEYWWDEECAADYSDCWPILEWD